MKCSYLKLIFGLYSQTNFCFQLFSSFLNGKNARQTMKTKSFDSADGGGKSADAQAAALQALHQAPSAGVPKYAPLFGRGAILLCVRVLLLEFQHGR